MRVLLIDNNFSNCLVARSILERDGHAVRIATSAFEGIELFQSSRFDSVLLDIVMPVMNGIEALKYFAKLTTADERPFFFALTAYDNADDVESYLKEGFDGVIAKPLRPGDLQRAIEILVQDGTPTLNTRFWSRPVASKRPLLDQTIIRNGPGLADDDTRKRILSSYRTGLSEALKEVSTSLPGCLKHDDKDVVRFREALHTLRSASLTVGLDRAPHLAGQVRDLPDDELANGVADLLYAVRDSLPALEEALAVTDYTSVASRESAVIVKMSREH